MGSNGSRGEQWERMRNNGKQMESGGEQWEVEGSNGKLREEMKSRGKQMGGSGKKMGSRGEQMGSRGEQTGSREEQMGGRGEQMGSKGKQMGSRDSDVINFAKSKTLMDHPFSFSNSFVTGRWRTGTAAQVSDINCTTADTI